jgi:DNA-binding protein H-NS
MANLLEKYGLDRNEWVKIIKYIEANPQRAAKARQELSNPIQKAAAGEEWRGTKRRPTTTCTPPSQP